MPVSYAKYIYPSVDNAAGKMLSGVNDITSDFMKCVVNYLDKEGIAEKQGIMLPGLSKASQMVLKAKKDAGKNELAVKGGLDTSGNLIVSVTGILPKKSGSGAEKYEKSEVVRAGFKKLLEEMKSEENVVVNMTKISESEAESQLDSLYEKYGTKDAVEASKEFKDLLAKYNGDKVINRASEKQAIKYKTTAKNLDEADFGNISTGTVVLAAHGGAVAASGTVMGVSLGKKSPDDILKLLTGNTDKNKNLSKKFSGTVLLSGCFTAAGSGAIPEGYDYSTFAGQVLNLLRQKGYTKCNVKGMPGPSITKDSGDKSARHAMTTDKGAEAFLQQLKAIEKAYADLLASHGGDKQKAGADPKYASMNEKWKKLKADREEVLNSQTEAKKAANRIDGLIGTFGLKGR
jgi:hypothetical protein